MAVKNPVKQQAQATETQTPDIAQEPTPVAASSAASGTNGHTGANGATKRGPKGPRTAAPYEWNRDMESALVAVLKPEKKQNEIRTAALVAYELNKTPAFASNPVTAQQVTSHVEFLQESLPNPKPDEDRAPMAVPAWLALDVVRRKQLDVDFWQQATA